MQEVYQTGEYSIFAYGVATNPSDSVFTQHGEFMKWLSQHHPLKHGRKSMRL